MISRGTNPLQTFQLPFDCSFIEEAEIVYAQKDKIIFTKTEQDISYEGNVIYFKLTQEETFLFEEKYPVQIETRIKLKNSNDIIKLPTARISVGGCLSDEVL
jgi:hypothetical protein